jgi:hypothetical protein
MRQRFQRVHGESTPAVAAQRQLLSIPVAVAATVPDDLLLVLDRRAVLSAYGPLQLAVVEAASGGGGGAAGPDRARTVDGGAALASR